MADATEVELIRLRQRVAALEVSVRELTAGGPSDELGSKTRPAKGIFVGDRSARGKIARLSYNSAAGTVKVDEV